MCKTKKIDFHLLRASKVSALLKNFPKCGVRYKTDGEYGVVLVHPSVRDQGLIAEKRDAAKIKATKEVYIVDLPLWAVDAVGI